MPAPPEQRFDYRKAITELREQRRMTREALAEAAGISASYLYEVERGLKRPSADILAKLALALGMLPSQVLEYMERQLPSPVPASGAAFQAMAARASRREWAAKRERAEPSPAASPGSAPLETLMAAARELDEDDLHVLLELARRLRKRDRRG